MKDRKTITALRSRALFRSTGLALLATSTVFAAADGTITNGTTGKPAAGVSVSLIQPGAGGMQTLGTTKTDASGHFRFDQSVRGPQLVQALFDGATYNKMLVPGTPTSGVAITVYKASTKAPVKISGHFIVFQPGENAVTVNEAIQFTNESKLTWNDPRNGTLHFFLPTAAKGNVQVTINTASGMPIQRPAAATRTANIYQVDYPVRPGETRFDLVYTLPPASPLIAEGKAVPAGAPLRLVAPEGVTFKGEGLEQIGQEPTTKASVYAIAGDTYKIEITGAVANASGAAQSDDDSGAPPIEQVRPKIYESLYWILGLAGAVLGLGALALLRRSPGPANQPRTESATSSDSGSDRAAGGRRKGAV